MAKPFNELRERLLRAGVAPRHVRRYLTELADHLADLVAEEKRKGRSRSEAESAALDRLGGMEELARAMIEQRQFQSWSARAPWAIFGVAPVLLLALAWLAALFILWTGWGIFLPGTETPFVRINGLAILFFGVGRSIFFGAPILAGWGLGLIAARQRLAAVWPTVGFILMALIGGSAQVHAHRPAIPGGLRHISMSFTLSPSVQRYPWGLFHALVILSLVALPYILWRLQKACFVSP
jgi:hypothetical protein